MGDPEVSQRSGAIGRRFGSLGQRQPTPIAQRRAQYRVDKPCGLWLPCISREIDGVVDHGGGWYPIQMQELVEAEAEDVEHIAVNGGQRSPREMFDQNVEAAPPAFGTRHDLRCECAVAFVGQLSRLSASAAGRSVRPSATARSA